MEQFIKDFKTPPKKDEPILAYHPVMGWSKTYGSKDLALYYTKWMPLPVVADNA